MTSSWSGTVLGEARLRICWKKQHPFGNCSNRDTRAAVAAVAELEDHIGSRPWCSRVESSYSEPWPVRACQTCSDAP